MADYKYNNMAEIIGRQKEIDILNRLYNSNKAQFVAVYGRRRQVIASVSPVGQ